eukprot:CAMPEP_0117469954 /NCGR_PEP_ID=MMETSP0784-20121206/6963_1 /TAXON_ID=39447 /ORGANISM="" /LENGTH=32 /DNA_ID= /DNA_START= /DNA_END= /DNA_ORIENTATION=
MQATTKVSATNRRGEPELRRLRSTPACAHQTA